MISNRIKLANDFELSRIVHGHWRLVSWKMSNQEILKLTQQAIELGITSFDHADIYGDYTCEQLFGDALNLKTNLRKDIQIITKCGINLISNKFPERKINYYDYSFDHIITSTEKSLSNFRTDYIDLLLLHRPAPFFNPEEVAKAFSTLKKSGKVLHFGVSNFTPIQFEMLNSYTDEKLLTNQVEISPYCLEHFQNGNIDFFLKERIKPMAWSPLATGKLIIAQDEKGKRLFKTLSEVAIELNVDKVDKVIYSWLLNHPVSIIPIAGTSKIERIKLAIEALNIKMSTEQWYKIYNASTGVEVP
ncbi:MAG: aldo/keto reductase [Bacteroidales bacterium]|nr:aldo/keto reductase [Bacteroidales bacterium]